MSDENSSQNITEFVLAEQSHMEIPSRPELIEPAVELLRQKAVACGVCSESRAGKLLIALHEALTNSIVHGNLNVPSKLKENDDDSFMQLLAERVADEEYAQRTVAVSIDYDGNRCRWTLSDEGEGFDVKKVLDRLNSDDPEVLLASGRGLLLMRSFLDGIDYEDEGRRAILTLERASGEERRTKPRTPRHERLHVAPVQEDGSIDWEGAYDAVARNYSQGGVGLIQKGLAQTSRVLIGVPVGSKPVYFPAEIRHCETLESGVVELGCSLQSEPVERKSQSVPKPDGNTTSAISGLLDSLHTSVPKTDDRRTDQRVPFTRRVAIRCKDQTDDLAGYARDISRGGIAFLTTVALTGEITLLIPAPDFDSPLQVRTEVVRCTKLQAGFYDIGGRFLAGD